MENLNDSINLFESHNFTLGPINGNRIAGKRLNPVGDNNSECTSVAKQQFLQVKWKKRHPEDLMFCEWSQMEHRGFVCGSRVRSNPNNVISTFGRLDNIESLAKQLNERCRNSMQESFSNHGQDQKTNIPSQLSSEGQSEPAEGTLPHSGETPANSPEKPTKKLRKLKGNSSPRNRSSVSGFASSSSYVLVSPRETFICETRSLEVPSNVIQAPLPVEIPPTQPIRKAPLGPRKRSPPRTPAARAPIQTRSRTAAALHPPSEETTDVFINHHPEEPLSTLGPVAVKERSSSQEPDSEECLADFPELNKRSDEQMSPLSLNLTVD
ncbi:hypothetical protein Pst134EA_004889 [Puccinia striiformis f. sp. tritici]|uniref:hypothetical protein n=1 Tax=Puccinia striiformis f. sp. tritici TaxID=168172 RepID=UPI00200788C2|nr:hypothetical protein Pst134EA_004889 [Puccinia striiformis f. sp. tritici]KAH9470979.1 hypothetical protein Pst134EA_004889 [Puccinia striiformis f. sp. tritici]